MLKIIKGGLLLLIAIYSHTSFAQNYYNSPYTRYGVGDLVNTGFAANRGMGGTAIALRSHNQVNYLNPASYTAQDTNSFLFQAGFAGRFVKVQTAEDSDQSNNMNIEYLAIGFPVKKWLNFSVGLVPYSRIQYAFTQEEESEEVGEVTSGDYTGFGGFNEFYVGGGLTIMKSFSLGVNFKYLFGSLDRTNSAYLTNMGTYSARIEQERNVIASDFYTTLGIQIHPTIAEKHTFILGATLDAKANIDVKEKNKTTRYNFSDDAAGINKFVDTVNYQNDTSAIISLPNKLGIGLSYYYDDKLAISADYITQDWSGMEIAPSSFTRGMYQSIRFGVDYIPSPLKNKTRSSYYKRMHYRAGAYYTKTYLYHDGEAILDQGISLGLGLPIKNSRNMFSGSALNIGYQFGIRGTTDKGLIKETYHNITLGITLHDFWFYKAKYN